jgi:DNA-binding NarL/FixJ family response regulator
MLNAEGDMQVVVGSAADGHAAVRQAALLQPDVVLLDINMPGYQRAGRAGADAQPGALPAAC